MNPNGFVAAASMTSQVAPVPAEHPRRRHRSPTSRPPSRSAELARRAGGALVIALIFFAPFAIGTVHVWTRSAVFLASALACALVLGGRLAEGRDVIFPLPAVALLVAVLATALQLVPLPAAVLARIAPATHETFSVTLGDYRWHALSLDPPGTWHELAHSSGPQQGAASGGFTELAKLGAYLAFFVAAVNRASRSERRRVGGRVMAARRDW